MEGVNWFRMSIIGLLFAVSAYVLLPTVLQVDPDRGEAEVVGPAERVDLAPDLDLELIVSGDAAAAAEVIGRRLAEMDIPTERVRESAGRVQVVLTPGSSRVDVESALQWTGKVGVHRLSDVAAAMGWDDPVEVDASLSATLAEPLAAAGGTVAVLEGANIPGTVVSITTMAPARGEGQSLRAVLAAPRDSDEPLVLSMDGLAFGFGLGRTEISILPFSEQDELPAVLRSGELPSSIEFVEVEEVASQQDMIDGLEVVENNVPSWLLAVLPDTRMNLGIDLQGGLDLTLQVELDQAVLSQASRDGSFMADRAAEDGITLTEVTVDSVDPIIQITTDGSLSDLQRWVAQNMRDYAYSETNDGVHAFEMTTARVREVHEQSVDQVLETLRKRVDATGVKEPAIVKKSGGRISVQLPGKVDLDSAIDAIGTTAILEFNLVDPDYDLRALRLAILQAKEVLPEAQFGHDPTLNTWLARNGHVPTGRKVMFKYEATETEGVTGPIERDFGEPLQVMSEVMLTGADINDARVSFDRNGTPVVQLDLKPRGGQVFCTVTRENVGERFAIALDGEVSSAPSINESICGGSAQITMGNGMDAMGEANNLALVLRTGSLDAPVTIGEIRKVGSLLGADAIRSGSIATVIGSIVVLMFMVIWYRKAGFLADIALVLNVLLVLAVLAMFGATLTLPGIAGIALTIGMAVDANIIIYERIREELALGQLARKAVDAGFDKGLVAVVDANITTAIAGIVLYSYGTGPIKGFAVTLLIGIGTTLITALFVTRTFMELASRSSTARLRL